MSSLCDLLERIDVLLRVNRSYIAAFNELVSRAEYKDTISAFPDIKGEFTTYLKMRTLHIHTSCQAASIKTGGRKGFEVIFLVHCHKILHYFKYKVSSCTSICTLFNYLLVWRSCDKLSYLIKKRWNEEFNLYDGLCGQ